jgi:hypothetical protein
MSHPNPERRENTPPRTSLLAGLPPEQTQAVTYGTGPLLLIASLVSFRRGGELKDAG